ncbi:type I polyketide synthase [Variovorax sp. KK3]|uniref:type I polyketide synthase n=1 Tax=Variovorax sp. KK3 TaxID=1855728 RepID=UPI00097C526E|nr:type I polyketide synthase [Variovorax sp. KK3]
MESSHRETGPQDSALALLDLFASADIRTGGEDQIRTSLDLAAALTGRAESSVRAAAWLPDTPFLAAWALAQARWTGIESVELHEASRTCRIDCRPSTAVASWLAGVDAARRGAGSARQPTNILISLDSTQPTAQLVLTRDAGLCDEGTASELLQAVAAIAEQLLAADATAELHTIATLSAAQREQQLHAWNLPATPYDRAASVTALFERHVAERPDALALVDGQTRMSYRELDRRATELAARLQAAGAAPGTIVGVALDRSALSIVALVAIVKTGAAYLPLVSSLPPDRLEFMVRDADARVVVTNAQRSAELPAGLTLVRADDVPAEAGVAFQPVAIDGETVAYTIYTSGSTGLPKGTAICHRSIIRLVVDAAYVDLSAESVVMHSVPLGFDVSTAEIWGALLNGGCCAVHDEDMPTGPGLARTIGAFGVTTIFTTAAVFNTVIDGNPSHLAGVKQIFIGGEAISVPHVRRSLAALPALKLVNAYGPTECTTIATAYAIPADLPADAATLPIGIPIKDTTAYVTGPSLELLPAGMAGELCLGGRGVAKGYLNRPELTNERFVADPFVAGGLLYRTGDRVRLAHDGNIEFLGRQDGQVKIRGHRIEIGEIEAALATHPAIQSSCVQALKDATGNARLVAYLVAAGEETPWESVRDHLAARLPEVMVPTAHIWMDALPITANGKIDRRALPKPAAARPDMAEAFEEPRSAAEARVCDAFARALGIDRAGRNDNFFDLGGDSLRVLRVLADLQKDNARTLTPQLIFGSPTPAGVAAALASQGGASVDPQRMPRAVRRDHRADEPIAVIAMAGRFPGASDVEQLWDNLRAERDSIRFFDDMELDPWVGPERADPSYVRGRGVLKDVDLFDAAFFGINPKEAELMDPQHRIFLELCWECFERAGHVPDSYPGPIGIYAGMNNGTYLQRHLLPRADLVEDAGEVMLVVANEKDYIATRVAHRLNLTGPAVSVHTACSTSLVAIAQAFHALRSGQCDMALAGGVSVTCPPNSGYLYQEGAMLSPDGHTRTFDANARGTVFSDGAAVVLLKPLAQALADGDPVCAVIRGAAINNDGGRKASFTAPSADGQAAVIAAALDSAGFDARSISYVEAHGTATPMGDPIEIEGLVKAFSRQTADTQFCAIGSLKSNLGHMVAAAGAGGVIKAALALEAESIPATLHFTAPNPAIDFSATPFHVANRPIHWPRAAEPRRAGVSSFGVGGTNAHVIVEEAPVRDAVENGVGPQVLVLSARTPAALSAAAGRLADHLEAQPGQSLADAAHTLQVGRKAFANRLCVVADSAAQAVEALRTADSAQRAAGTAPAWEARPVFMFPGQGAQYHGMGRDLHAQHPAFRAAFDDCLRAFEGAMDADLRQALQSDDPAALSPTSVTQPATFALEYAMARQLIALGVHPQALVGHSVGEFVAAVLSGVMRLEDAARLVARRGALMQSMEPGSMLSVRLPAAQLAPRLPEGISLAADNGPTASVAAGPTPLIEAFAASLEADGIVCRVLQTSHAFHSSMMDGAVAPFEALVRSMTLSAPLVPVYSTLTGELLTTEQATDPRYWARHLRETVRFSPAIREVQARESHPLFIEVGPRNTLTMLVRQHAAAGQPVQAVALGSDRGDNETLALRLAAGRLWTLGAQPDLTVLDTRTRKQRVRLPTYPFERKRFWIDAVPRGAAPVALAAVATPSSAITLSTPSTTLPEPAMTVAASAPASAPSRRASLVSRLREVFENVSGADMGHVDGTVPFIEIGLDSLTLTQAALQVKKTFKVNLTFRQLMESYRSFDALAEFLDATLPPEAAPAAPVAVAAAAVAPQQAVAAMPVMAAAPVVLQPLPAMTMTAVNGGAVQQLIAQQMQLMQQQLALLSAVPQVPASPVLPAQVVEQPTPEASAAATASNTPTAPQAAEPGAEEALPAIKYDVKKAFGAIARIHTQSKEPTERQKARLAAFIRRYIDRTQKSKAFTAENRSHMADPRVVNGFRPATKEITYQIVVDRSKGSRVWDIDGNEYVDVLNGFGMNLFGWTPDFINDAVRKQLDLGYEIGPQHPLAADVSKLLCELTGFDRAGLCNTGSEAVMGAMRIARTVTGRNTVVTFTGSYHGIFDEVLVRAGRNAKGMSAAPGVMQGMFGDIRVLEYGAPESLEFIRTHADELAAVIVEPVQSRRPEFQPKEFLREIRAITEKSQTCFIFDEVITGFRCDLGGAQNLFGIRADLATYGKVLGGGFPVGVIAGKRQFMDALDGGAWQYGDDSVPGVGVTYFAGTFVRHPLALAAAKASLEFLKQDNNKLQTQLNLHTAALADELTAFCREVGAPIEIRYFSSLWRITWLEDHPLQDLLFAMMRSRGVHILDNFPCFMTASHTQQDIATIKSAFKESVAELQEAEMLPRRAAPKMTLDPSHPPTPTARLGRDKDGQPAWFVPDPKAQGKFTKYQA